MFWPEKESARETKESSAELAHKHEGGGPKQKFRTRREAARLHRRPRLETASRQKGATDKKTLPDLSRVTKKAHLRGTRTRGGETICQVVHEIGHDYHFHNLPETGKLLIWGERKHAHKGERASKR